MKFRGTLVRILLMVLVISLTAMFLMETTEGQTIIPVVQASFDYSSKTADVEPGNPSGGIVMNTGTIHCDCGSQPRVDVSLTINAGGWPATITPESMTFYWGGVEEQDFDVTIAAPEGTSRKVSQQIIVGGSWQGAGGLIGDVDQSSMIIFIEQYFTVILELNEPEVIEPGGGGNISFKIWNQGNDEDRFIIEVDNLKDLAHEGWSIPTVGSQTVEEKGVRSLRIYVRAPDEEGTYHFEITVTSEGSRLANPDDVRSAPLDVFVEVKKGGSGSDGGNDDDEGDGLPFPGSIEVIAIVLLATVIGRRRK